ncbi:M20/M25/M40 family metallo-hydrolase [Weissella confusa]|uniref:M20/M25/M40 family metallo-hydrolase n=1 Tax=Weissella confusa TaxID=1583 RepID=UPI0018F205A4|nr:M20/M25/M40 family metallo-hydrolase [Weissella confusa]MBJ7620961.1 M20/M25/M40 family metallo-hydrolase [Weissella confusa]MBJ7668320.1 M20/M25/M40 family metallo-hydrolase [Weissella confusa]
MSSNREKNLQVLSELVAIPSVSARREGQDVAAKYLRDVFRDAGAEVTYDDSFPAPFVLAKFLSDRPDAKTLVLYNHYDVQPEDPIALWETDPFTLTEKDGRLYGRGVADDKGHITSRLEAVEDYLALHETLPVNVYFVVEGAEESGSEHFKDYLEKYAYEFENVDLVIWESGTVHGDDRLEVFGGNKGIITFTLSAQTAAEDIHSSFAAVVDSAAWRLIDAIASLRGQDGEILIDGLYDTAREPNEREQALVRGGEVTPESLKRDFGLRRPLLTETTGEDFYDNLFFKSNLNIEGIQSGYQGPGVKTVTPASATAKLEIRLVPGQEPQDVFDKLVDQLKRNGFGDVEATLTLATPGYRSDMSAPRILSLVTLAEQLYQTVEVSPTSAGTGPMYWANKYIGAPIAAVGLAYDGSQIHAPNENIRLSDYEHHVALVTALIADYSEKD